MQLESWCEHPAWILRLLWDCSYLGEVVRSQFVFLLILLEVLEDKTLPHYYWIDSPYYAYFDVKSVGYFVLEWLKLLWSLAYFELNTEKFPLFHIYHKLAFLNAYELCRTQPGLTIILVALKHHIPDIWYSRPPQWWVLWDWAIQFGYTIQGELDVKNNYAFWGFTYILKILYGLYNAFVRLG